jgi:arylsulfatase A-like enzyme
MNQLREKGRGIKFRYLIILGVLLALGVLLWWAPWQDSVMFVRVNLSTDSKGSVTLYRHKTVFQDSQQARPRVTADLDLSRWEGQLIRLDIQDSWKKRGSRTLDNYVGWDLQLRTPDGNQPRAFIGWVNSDLLKFHRRTIGSPAYLVKGTESPALVYSKDHLLWQVLRVPKGASLRVSFRPALEKEVAGKATLFLPAGIAASPPLKPAPTPPAPARPPDVFIYLIDTLRADHLHCYGYNRETSPAIDEFAKDAAFFEKASSAWDTTLASVTTLFTGLPPAVHQTIYTQDRIDGSLVLLPEIARKAGYETASIVTNPRAIQYYGFGRGVKVFNYKWHETADWVNARAAEFLAQQKPQQPVFMYLHTIEPHLPYDPKPETFRRFDRGFKGKWEGTVKSQETVGALHPKLDAEDWGYLIDHYDADIYDNDVSFGKFLQLLKKTGRWQNAVVVLVADHGESFGEQDTWGHGLTLSQQEIHVPLIIHFPAGRFAGKRIKTPVSLIDIFPTIAALVGVRPKLAYPLPGIDLTALASGAVTRPRPIFSEASKEVGNGNNKIIDLIAIIDEAGYKQVIDASSDPGVATKASVGLWDSKTDEKEKQDLSRRFPVLAAYHEQRIALWLQQQRFWRAQAPPKKDSKSSPSPMSEKMRRELRALGYLD